MQEKDEKARIEAAVQERLAEIMAVQQAQFSKMMEKAMKDALKGIDKTNATLQKEQKAVIKELDAIKKARAKAEKEGDKMAQEYFEGRQNQFVEAAKTELLRDLTRMHLLDGKTPQTIATWLNVPISFVTHIQQLLQRLTKYEGRTPKRSEYSWSQNLRYSDYGRGGTVYYESPEGKFDMWWEFGGGKAVVILDIPKEENWEAVTKIPLSKRVEVLTCIAEQIMEDKMSSSNASFVIGENVITFYAD
jgi:hypothetical protein